jgi:hypothetical protein
MKMIQNALVLALCFGAIHTAHAQFGSLGKTLGGGSSADAGGDITGDVASFVTKSAALSALSTRSVTAINSAFSTAEESAKKRAMLESIEKITDAKEKQAKYAEQYASEAADAKKRLDSGAMEKEIGGLSDTKKKQIGTALLNFGIGALQAVDLTKTGQNIVAKVSTNPLNVIKVVPVKDTLPMLGDVVKDGGGLLTGMLKLAKGANISVPAVTSSSKAEAFIE